MNYDITNITDAALDYITEMVATGEMSRLPGSEVKGPLTMADVSAIRKIAKERGIADASTIRERFHTWTTGMTVREEAAAEREANDYWAEVAEKRASRFVPGGDYEAAILTQQEKELYPELN